MHKSTETFSKFVFYCRLFLASFVNCDQPTCLWVHTTPTILYNWVWAQHI